MRDLGRRERSCDTASMAVRTKPSTVWRWGMQDEVDAIWAQAEATGWTDELAMRVWELGVRHGSHDAEHEAG